MNFVIMVIILSSINNSGSFFNICKQSEFYNTESFNWCIPRKFKDNPVVSPTQSKSGNKKIMYIIFIAD